jgi:hypothetical protein
MIFVRKILTIVLLSLIIFTGCKKDKDENSYDNYIKYDDKAYPLDKGILENWGKWSPESDNNLDLTLVSDSVNVIEWNNEVDSYSGTGHRIKFWMYSASSELLDNGNYTYDDLSSEKTGTFDYGQLLINYNFDNEEGEIEQYVADGTVTVTKSGDTYEITINCTDEEGKSVTGYYKGILKYFDYNKKKSTKTEKRKF